MNKDVTDLNTIKQWFKTGSKPTQEQFWAWQDSFFHKEETIPQDQIEDLATTLEKKADSASLETIETDIETLKTEKATITELNEKANLTDLENKANADATNIDAQKFYEAIKEHIPTSGGGTGGTADITKEEVTKMFADLTIGGANLVKNTALPIFTQNSVGRGTPSVMKDETGYFVRYTPDSDKAVSVYGFFLENSHLGNHSVAMDFRHSHSSNVTIWGQSIPPNTWIRVKKEGFKQSNGWGGFSADVNGVAIDVREYKIEKGGKCTDYTPNIEEYVLGASPTKIDQVFAWSSLEIGAENNGSFNRVIYDVPYLDFISTILECYLIFTNGESQKVTDYKYGIMVSGKIGIAFNSSIVGNRSVSKLYLKALLK